MPDELAPDGCPVHARVGDESAQETCPHHAELLQCEVLVPITKAWDEVHTNRSRQALRYETVFRTRLGAPLPVLRP